MSATIDQPIYTLQVAFNGPGVPVWTTIGNVRQFSIKRGRNDELGTVQAGTLTVVVGNPTGALSPDNAAGPYYGSILPVNPIRLVATYAGVPYTRFRGFVQAWLPIDNTVVDADVRIEAVDWFSLANLATVSGTFAAQDEGARVAAILAATDTRNLPTAIDAGNETALAATLDKVAPLTHIGDVLAGERGLFFVAADGTLTYHNRYHRADATTSNTSQATFGQSRATGALNYLALDYVLDDRYIYNAATVNASGSDGTREASDAASVARYGPRALPTIVAPYLTAGYAGPLAEYLVALYATPRARVRAITIDSDANPALLLPQQLGREIGDRITVQKNSPGVLGLDRDFYIEGVSEDWDGQRARGHTTTWQLSDVMATLNPFRLDLSDLDGPDLLLY